MGTGNTFVQLLSKFNLAVQPRGYGEHLATSGLPFFSAGSAPWVRGTHREYQLKNPYKRFSPVGTGNTQTMPGSFLALAVQPRGYGEHAAYFTLRPFATGSAPWVRGTPKFIKPARKSKRFSPVGTGNTQVKRFSALPLAVQPRGYGEHPAHISN